MKDLGDSTILITGATDGLGKAVAVELARAGATVLVHGRDDARGGATLREIRDETGGDRTRWYRADLASLDEVRALAEHVRTEHERLDVLVNNAGIGTVEAGDAQRLESRDGYELRFAVNYLAPFLLTRLLLPTLLDSTPSRIVNVSSAGQAPIDFDDVMLEHGYDGVRAYCQSKLALVMLTIDLADELAGQGVTANCLHPGTYMPTKIVLEEIGRSADSLETGVESTVRLATSPELEGVTGRFFDRQSESSAQAQAYDADARRRLWDLSVELTGVTA